MSNEEIKNNNQEEIVGSLIIPDIDDEENTEQTNLENNNQVVEPSDENIKKEKENKEESFDIDTTLEDSKEAFTKEANDEIKRNENMMITDFKNIKVTNLDENNFMDKIKIDLNNIKIIEKPILQQNEDLTFMVNNNSHTFPVVCCQSGYRAQMAGLTLSEKNAINNSNLNLFESRQILYKTVYNKIKDMGFPKPKFDDWLKITSFGDLNTLLFGIYCQTYTDNNDFDITCGKCKKKTSVTVDNQSMIEVKDKNIYSKIDEILTSVKAGEELVNKSYVNEKHRIILDKSKIIFDIKNPTLWDHLVLIKQSKQEIVRQYPEAFSALLFISNMYMPETRSFMKGNPAWYEIKDRPRILNTVLNLSTQDGDQLENYIESELGKYKITYEISNITCSHCHSKLPNIPIDMESVLFTRINKQMKEEK